LAQQPNRPAIAFRHLGLSHNANSMTDDMAGMDAYRLPLEKDFLNLLIHFYFVIPLGIA
jgi:hypothetical protein